jgi:hypothetical protein
VRDRPNLKLIAPRRLLESISIARGLCSVSSLVDSQHTLGSDSDWERPEIDQVDIEMGSGSGTDYDPGLCPLGQ